MTDIKGAITAKVEKLGINIGTPDPGGVKEVAPGVWKLAYIKNGATSASGYYTEKRGALLVYGYIFKKYASLGAETGFLGFPTTDELGTGYKGGRYNHFEGGSIYWTSKTGAFEVHGAIRKKWGELGWEKGFLGYPLTDEKTTPDKIGRYNHFEGGSIYWTPKTGAFEVHDAIKRKWSTLGWENGYLGYPLTDEKATPDKIGRYNHFQGGSIYWKPGLGASAVRKEIRDEWGRLGWERGKLGYPTGDTSGTPETTLRNTFENGCISWNRSTGYEILTGATTPKLNGKEIASSSKVYTLTSDSRGTFQKLEDLGRGYNVFGLYASPRSLKQPVLDYDKLVEAGQVLVADINSATFSNVEGETQEKYAEKQTTKVKLGGGYMGFTASVENSFSSGYREERTSYYMSVRYVIMHHNLFLKAWCNFKNFLIPEVKEILDTGKLHGAAYPPARIFENFGSHVLIDGIFGGRLEYNVTADSTKCGSFSNFQACVKADYNVGFASVSTEVAHESTVEKEEYNKKKSTTVFTYGGIGQDGLSALPSRDQQATPLQKWRDSVETRLALVEFGGTLETPLLPIWELCSSPSRAAELEKAFKEYAKGRELAVPVKAAVIHEHKNFRGRRLELSKRNYPNLEELGFDCKISSIEVSPDYIVKAYTDEGCQGKYRIFDNDAPYVSPELDEKIRSLEVAEVDHENSIAAVIYQHADYGGAYQQLTYGVYPDMEDMFVDDDSVSSMRVTPGYTVVIHQYRNFEGDYWVYNADSPSFGKYNDKCSSITIETAPPGADSHGGVFYQYRDFGGRALPLIFSEFPTLEKFGFNDTISSMQIRDGYRVLVYVDSGFRGPFRVFEGSVPFVGNQINDRISSIEFRRADEESAVAAVIYQQESFKGLNQQLILGSYPNMNNLFVGNDSVSSIRVTPGYRVLLYEHINFGGKCVSYHSDAVRMGSFNDKTSSIQVVKI